MINREPGESPKADATVLNAQEQSNESGDHQLTAIEGTSAAIEGTSADLTFKDSKDLPVVVAFNQVANSASSVNEAELPIVPGYEVKGLLGKGGMGLVYLATQISAKREVALKLVQDSRANNTTILQRFALEAQAAARIEHPHVVTIYEVNTQGAVPFFSMQFVRGVSLLEVAKQGASPHDLARYVAQIARGVQAAHDLGILHRDLKPENILVDQTRRHAYVTDFGLAKPADVDTSLTRDGDIFGTPAYMSPEQLHNMADAKAASDIFSLGATLYRVITGRMPFEAPSVLKLFEQIQNVNPVAPRSLNPKIPRDLETICLKCLEKNPAQRYPSMNALARDLEAFIDGEPITARPVGAIRRSVRWVRKHPLAVTSAFFAAIALSLGLFVVPLLWESQREAQRFRQIRQQVMLLQTQIESATLDELFEDQLQNSLQSLRDQDLESYVQVATQLNQRQVAGVSERLDHPRLSSQDLDDLQSKLSEIQEASAQQDLQGKLDKRRTAWTVAYEKSAPFGSQEGQEQTLGKDQVARIVTSSDRMNLHSSDPKLKYVRYSLELNSSVREQLTVNFLQDWSAASQVGVFLDARQRQDSSLSGWYAALKVPLKSASADGQLLKTFEQLQQAGVMASLEIYDGEDLMSSRAVDLQNLVGKPLSFRLRREGDNVTLSLNQLPLLSVQSTLSIDAGDMGSPGVIWPIQASVSSILLERADVAPGTQPLEDADLLYRTAQFQQAIDAYNRLRETANDRSVLEECLFKRGLCHLQMKDDESAKSTFQEILSGSDSVWAMRASLQLLYLFQLGRNFQESRGVVTEMIAKFQPSKLRASSPQKIQDDIANLIFNNYLQSAWVQRTRHRERIQLAVEAFKIMDRPIGDQVQAQNVQFDTLSTFEAASAELDAALQFADKVVRNPEANGNSLIGVVESVSQLALWTGRLEVVEPLLKSAAARLEKFNASQIPLIDRIHAQLAYCQGDYNLAGQILDRIRERLDTPSKTDLQLERLCECLVLKGWCEFRQGRVQEAKEIWAQGFHLGQPTMPSSLSVSMMGSLSGAITDDHARQMYESVVANWPGEIGVNFFQQYVPMNLIESGAIALWQSDYGHEMSERIASGRCSIRCTLTGQLTVSVFLFLKQMTRDDPASRDMSASEGDAELRSTCESLRLGFESSRITQQDFISIGSIYLNLGGGFFGFNAFASSKAFQPEEKAVISYYLACHLIRSKRWPDAKRALDLAERSQSPVIVQLAQQKRLEIPK